MYKEPAGNPERKDEDVPNRKQKVYKWFHTWSRSLSITACGADIEQESVDK